MLKHGERTRRRHHQAGYIREDAAADLRLIREAMDHSSRFTDVPGLGMVVLGGTALIAAWLAAFSESNLAWVAIWGVELAVAVTIAAAGIALKALQNGTQILALPVRRFLQGMIPPLVAGGVLTAFCARMGLIDHLPGVLLLLYGTALLTGSAFSLGLVRILGISFMALGALTLFLGPDAGDAAMALGFGGFHIAFGAVIARRYGG